MDPAMGESKEGNVEPSESSGAAHVNGEINGLSDDPLEQADATITSLKSIFSDSKNTGAVSDDESISSKENGGVKVPNKDCVNSSIPGTKVPTSGKIKALEVDLENSDSEDSITAIEEKDPLESLGEINDSVVSISVGNVSDELNSSDKLDSKDDDSKTKNHLNDVNHKATGKEVKQNGNSARCRSPDVEEISNDSVKMNNDEESPERNADIDMETDAAKDEESPKSTAGTPAKVKKSRKSHPSPNVTPRRSSRNLSRVQKTYSESKDELDPAELEDESDVEEIAPVDPLAEPSKPIIVKDTRKLVEIAAGARGIKGGAKKEPTLVIIDTNSILAGRGAIPISQSHNRPSSMPSTSRSTQGYTILPIGLSAQSVPYPKARITPYPQPYPRPQPIQIQIPTPKPQPPPPPPPQILPTLTDDMYVVEAPSFIVPYVYEKPPLKPLKDFIKKLRAEIDRLSKLEEEEEAKKKKDTEEAKEKDIGKNDKSSTDSKEETNGVDGDSKVKDQEGQEIENGEKSSKDKKVNDDDKSSEDEDDDKKEKKDVNSSKEDLLKDGANLDDSISEIKVVSDGTVTKVDSDKEKPTGDASSDKDKDKPEEDKPKTQSYFDNPLGKFFMQIGANLVTEHVQTDLLRHQRRKRNREGQISQSAQYAVNALLNNLEVSKENNKPFHLPIKKCEYCSFKTESALVMAQHLETPHMRNYVYRCNYCPLEVRSPHDILFHMEAEHNVRGRLERAPGFHQCPSCPFEDNQKGKLTRHLMSCSKKYKPEKNLEPPIDWEPPAKIPRVSRNRPASIGLGTAAYQAMIAKQAPQHSILPKLIPAASLTAQGSIKGRGRPTMQARFMPDMKVTAQGQRPIIQSTQMRQGMLYRPSGSGSQPQVLLPTTYQMGNQLFHGSNNKHSSKMPSISITPLPRQPVVNSNPPQNRQQAGQAGTPGKTYVICEICDGYIKDLEQLRNHMLWIHKVKIHPKMIHNRPPLNCQKCQCRFFTDQGLERHLLGTHGLVTSSMQEAANKGKDAGRCPACGRVYQWKLLNHVARDHGMSLKPAHLSYKCTVCTATFGMYKQFENHVYSAHSTQAKRVMDKKPASTSQVYRSPNEPSKSLLKPLKMNDEITIIPQPQPSRYRAGPASRTGKPTIASLSKVKVYSCQVCEASFDGAQGFSQYTTHVRKIHLQRVSVKLCRLDGCSTCKNEHMTQDLLDFLEEHKSNVDVIELSDDEVVIAGQGRNEITITKVASPPGPRRFKQRLQNSRNVQLISIDDSPSKGTTDYKENGEDSLVAVKERLRRRKSLEISQVVDTEVSTSEPGPSKKRRRNND